MHADFINSNKTLSIKENRTQVLTHKRRSIITNVIVKQMTDHEQNNVKKYEHSHGIKQDKKVSRLRIAQIAVSTLMSLHG